MAAVAANGTAKLATIPDGWRQMTITYSLRLRERKIGSYIKRHENLVDAELQDFLDICTSHMLFQDSQPSTIKCYWGEFTVEEDIL